MPTSSKSKKKLSPTSVSRSKQVASETANTSESAWIMAFLKQAATYLSAFGAFLLALKVAEVALIRLSLLDPKVAASDKVVLLLIASAGLLLAFFFNIRPALRRRHELNRKPVGAGAFDYFDTAPRDKDPYGFFSKGYDYLYDWISSSSTPLLFLTGLSGSGKSSVINAFLRPRLGASDPKTHVVIIRSYASPLSALQKALVDFRGTSLSKPRDNSPLSEIGRVAKQLQGEKLLIVFDQFEEFFLLRSELSRGGPDTETVAPRFDLDGTDFTELRDFFKAFLYAAPKGVSILLSYRQDYQALLAPLQLPPRVERNNWMSLEPLDFAAAALFLQSCPGLNVPQDRMDRVLAEAARQEGGRVVMRPIVANLLGLILRRMADHPTLWRRSDNLLRKYVRDAIHGELQTEHSTVLQSLLTDFQTARPRTVAEIARASRLDFAALEIHLEHLGRAGLVRCINDTETDVANRVWQISHDFIASLIELVLVGLRRSIWRTLRPWLAPAVIVALFGVWTALPQIRKQKDLDSLSELGYSWNATDATLSATLEGRDTQTFANLSELLSRFDVQRLDFSDCSRLDDLDGLDKLSNLTDLRLRNCTELQNIDDIAGLVRLRRLDMQHCISLSSIDRLTNLENLQYLNLGFCSRINNLAALSHLDQITDLTLSGCQCLKTTECLQGLSNLEQLDLSECLNLQKVRDLKNLRRLSFINLQWCFELTDISGLGSLPRLTDINLTKCQSLRDVSCLGTLPALERLNLSDTGVQNAAALRPLVRLEKVSFSHCSQLTDIADLRFLKLLKFVDLSDCESLQNVDSLSDLSKLEYLNLSGCTSLNANSLASIKAALPRTKIIY